MKIVFTDIDGTLSLGKEVPSSAMRAIERFRAKGNLVFIATGRNINYVRDNFSLYADGFITNNGRLAYYKENVIFDQPMDKEVVHEISDCLEKLHAGAAFHSKTKGYYVGPEDLKEVMAITSDPGYLKDGLDENEDLYNFDICFYDEKQKNEIKEALKDLCILNPHGPHPSADMTVKGCDKGDALKAVAKALMVKIEDTYAFGDGRNDICMLKAAGHGIAMGNALRETKQAAEFVTKDIDKDGLYWGFVHYGLIEEE